MQLGNEWFFRAGALTRGDWETVVDAGIPGWQHTVLRIGRVRAGDQLLLDAGEVERIVVPLGGSFEVALTTSSSGARTVPLVGRHSVFDGPTDVFYIGSGSAASITGDGRVAVAEVPTTLRRPDRYIAHCEVPIELRGAGGSSRQVHNFGTPSTLDAARMIVCEVITPAGNWSSYPAHKHDQLVPGTESRLNEIYYFESAVTRGSDGPPAAEPFGLFATYSSPTGQIDTNALVRTGDVALVPYGYHGPAAAAPGYDLYYLNVMAGPDEERAWNITDDSAHAWIRNTWDEQEIDPRLPYRPVSERGPR